MNATATTPADTAVVVPAVSATGRPNYVALNGRVHRATCKRRGTYKGGAAPMIGSAPMMARLEGVKPATCCKPERAADWKAALEPVVIAHDEVSLTDRVEHADGTREVVDARPRLALVAVKVETPAVAVERTDVEGDRHDTTERMVTLTADGVKVRALYVSRTYRGDAKKPYRGVWVLESNGATIAGGPATGYTVNGLEAGKGPLGAVAVKAAQQG